MEVAYPRASDGAHQMVGGTTAWAGDSGGGAHTLWKNLFIWLFLQENSTSRFLGAAVPVDPVTPPPPYSFVWKWVIVGFLVCFLLLK